MAAFHNDQDELRDLVAQALEYARYYRELGVAGLEEAETRLMPGGRSAEQIEMPRKSGKSSSGAGSTPTSTSGGLGPPPSLPLITNPVVSEAVGATPPVVESLEDIRRDLGDCRRCKLWSTRTNIVFGEGDPRARLMFVGEGPGADEDLSGRPFVGRAGQLLTRMIEAIGLTREQVYIANVVKSRPPENRNPERDEVVACIPFLLRQIAVIRPKLIVTLGNPATQAILDTSVGITRLRGNFQDYPRLPGIKVMPTFHPAYLLRSPDKKREAWEDLKMVRDLLNQITA
jgi:uracil-DNA glycosylase